MNTIVAPSILSADFANLQRDIEMINQSNADWFHIDVMDGVFVPNISFGFPVIKAIKQHSTKPLDVHLMIVNPDQYLSAFRDSGADIVTVHLEACTHLHRTVQAIKQLGMKAGVAINPHTPVSALEDIVADLDLALIMSVNPGFGGQTFIERTYNKLHFLREIISENEASCIVEVDGGVNNINAPKLIQAGANALVAGNYVFGASDPLTAINSLKI